MSIRSVISLGAGNIILAAAQPPLSRCVLTLTVIRSRNHIVFPNIAGSNDVIRESVVHRRPSVQGSDVFLLWDTYHTN